MDTEEQLQDHIEETKRKIIEAHKRLGHNPVKECHVCNKPFGYNRPNKGKKLKCRKCWREQNCAENASNWKGGTSRYVKCKTEACKRKISPYIKSNFCTKCIKQLPLVKEKMSMVQRGKTVSEESRKKMSIARIGEKHWNWRGGKSLERSLASKLRNTKKYKDWRKAVIEIGKNACQVCDATERLEADHIIPFSILLKEHNINTLIEGLNCDALWDITNGRVLCKNCHKNTETYGGNVNNDYGIKMVKEQETTNFTLFINTLFTVIAGVASLALAIITLLK